MNEMFGVPALARGIKLVGVLSCALTPLLFPGWFSLVAEAYSTGAGGEINGALAANALRDACAGGGNARGTPRNQAFQRDCALLLRGEGSDPVGTARAYDSIAASQLNAQNSAAIRTQAMSVSALVERLERIRAASGFQVYRAQASSGASGGGASGDLAMGRFGGFLGTQYLDGEEDETGYQPGFAFHGWNLSGGVDYRFTDQLVAGAYLQYWNGRTGFDDGRGRMDTASWSGALYATYFLPSGLYVDGLVSYAANDYDLRRNLVYAIDGQSANQVASASPNADLWNLSLGGGYTMSRGDLSFTPMLHLTYLNNAVDGYVERMSDPNGVGGGLAQSLDAQVYESLRSNLGFQVTKAIGTAYGVFSPQARVAWVHEFLNGQERVGSRFVDDIGNTPFYVLTNSPDHDYFDLGLGVSAQFPLGRSVFISYNTLLGYSGVSYNAINAGVRIEF